LIKGRHLPLLMVQLQVLLAVVEVVEAPLVVGVL
jgi:hypothetical protein